MTQQGGTHWLRDVGAAAGLHLRLSTGPDVTTLRRAWAEVARALGATDEAFTQRVARHFRIGLADLSSWDPEAIQLIPETVARRYGIIPVSVNRANIVVATSDPANASARADIVASSRRQPVFLVASPAAVQRALDEAYAADRLVRSALQTLVDKAAANEFAIVTNDGVGRFTSFELEAPAVVKLADVILQQAVRHRTTEIFVQPGRAHGRVRFRIDGVLQHFVDLPTEAQNRLVLRLKHLARGNSGDGFPIRLGPTREFRAILHVTTTPDGEMVSIRLVAPGEVPTLATLNLDAAEAEKIQRILPQKDGLVLVTGPARSGKTSFIYAALQEGQRLNVVSLENPVELVVSGATQIQYNPGAGRSFAEQLGSLLEQDPDVLHAGEIRDLATARLTLRAAVTGRRVLATVHSPNTVSGIRRLIDMGLAAPRLAESLRGVVSLRLVRRLCPKCSVPVSSESDLSPEELKLSRTVGLVPARRAVGCQFCGNTGYREQIPIAEVLEVTSDMRSLLAAGASDAEVEKAARLAGMRTLAEAGLGRVRAGLTTLEEIERALGTIPPVEGVPAARAVLVVDDNAQDRMLLGSVLGKMGFRVVEAESASSAQDLMAPGNGPYSLVVLQLLMRGTMAASGKELLRRIRESRETQSVPVIVLTDSPDPRDEIEILEAGADDLVLKPLVPDRIEARVRAVLRRGGGR